MNQTNVVVSFYLKQSEADEEGYCPVMARLNIGKYFESAFEVEGTVQDIEVRAGDRKESGNEGNQ